MDFSETGDNMIMIFNNNVGCCHFALGKPTIAAWYFQKASQECDKKEYKDRRKLSRQELRQYASLESF